jgi:intron-binding protein aquarius
LIIDFISILNSPSARSDPNILLYCERFVELLIDLQSQLPTRKYTNVLIVDLHTLVAVRLSSLYKDVNNTLFRDLVEQLEHYVHFAVNSYTSEALSEDDIHEAHCRELARLQKVALQYFKDKLTVLALSNYASIDKRAELSELLAELDDEEVIRLCDLLRLRTSYPEGTNLTVDKPFLIEVLVERFQRRQSYVEQARNLSIYPTEKSLFDPRILEYEDLSLTSRPLPLPKLNLQYLTIPDFLYRSFLLSRYESQFSVRVDIEDTLRRLNPEIQYPLGNTIFKGWSKMAIKIPKVSVMEVQLPRVGEEWPSLVRGEVDLDLETLPKHARREWAQVRPDDVLFLLSIKLSEKTTNGTAAKEDYAKNLGIQHIRSAEVMQILDEEGRQLRGTEDLDEIRFLVPKKRTLKLQLDAKQWNEDNALFVAGKSDDIYDSMNVLIRRRSEVVFFYNFT